MIFNGFKSKHSFKKDKSVFFTGTKTKNLFPHSTLKTCVKEKKLVVLQIKSYFEPKNQPMKKLIDKLIYCTGFMLVSLSSFNQNLIKNPGFEFGLNNWSLWSKEGTGKSIVVSEPVHTGQKALKIDYQGNNDWALNSSEVIKVNAGDIYEMSCWVSIASLVSEANMSLVLYDDKRNVINWVFNRIKMDKKLAEYTQFRSKFVVPQSAAYIQLRLEGWAGCVLYADDFSLSKYEIDAISGEYIIENEKVKAVIQLPEFTINLMAKSGTHSVQTNPAQFAAAKSVEFINAKAIKVNCELLDEQKSPISIEFALEDKALKMNIDGDSELDLSSDFQFPGSIASRANDYFIVPRATGIMFPVSEQYPFWEFSCYGWKATMPFIGVTNMNDGYMVCTHDQYDAVFQFTKPPGENLYTFNVQHKPAKSKLGYDRIVFIVLVENGYVEMCKWYREIGEKSGFVKTLNQKRKENPNIDKLIGAVDFWPLSMNIDPSFISTVKLMGIDKAMWNLTGSWGQPNFSVLIDSINANGFLSNRYDIFTDVWPPTHPEWQGYRTEGYPEDVVVDKNGELQKGWTAYPNGQEFQGYYTCGLTHWAYAHKYVTQDLKVNKYNSRFIDVELSSALTECFSPDHPTTRRQDAESRTELLAFIKNFYRLVTGTEEAHDFAFQNLDYSEGTMTIAPAENAGYDWSQPLENTDKAYYEQNISTRYRIPLHGLVYHDVHIPTWYTGDGVSKVPAYWEDKDLWNILYGTMPLYLPPSRSYWDSNLEKFMSGYHLMSTVSRNVGYAKMINHQFLSEDHNLQETDFDNGWKVVVNFDSIPRNLAGKTLAPKGFYASAEEKDEAGKMIFDDKTIAWALSSNRLFFNPYGVEASKLGLRSSKSVFMEKFADYLLVSFIGNQNYIDFNIDDLPFDVKEISKVVEYYTAREISLITTDDGWKQLRRPTGKSYFKLYYGPKTTRLETGSLSPGLKIYPNPAQNQLFIEHLNHNAQLTVCNINGQRLIEKSLSDSKSHIDIGFLASGVYFLKVVQNGSSEVLKFIKN